MARRGWGRSLFLAALAAAGTAAAQLGLGYGLGIIVWAPDQAGSADAAWAAGLAWTVWTAATSVVVGAVIGDRVAGNVHSGRVVRFVARVTTGIAAALGGLVTIPLVAVPTQDVRIVDTFAPNLLAGIYAAAGVVIGLIVSLPAMTSRAVAANVFATTGFVWLLAIVAVSDGGTRGEVTQLGIWKFTNQGPVWHGYYVPGALLLLGGALMLGRLAAFPAAGRGEGRWGVTVSGVTGPILVALAYTLAAPRPGQATVEQLSAFHTSPYMIVAGLAGSALVGAVGAGPARRTPKPAKAPTEVPSPQSPPPRPAARVPKPPPAVPAPSTFPTPDAGRRSGPLPAASASAVTAKASVPPESRINPEDWRPA